MISGAQQKGGEREAEALVLVYVAILNHGLALSLKVPWALVAFSPDPLQTWEWFSANEANSHGTSSVSWWPEPGSWLQWAPGLPSHAMVPALCYVLQEQKHSVLGYPLIFTGPLELFCDIGRMWIFPRSFNINLVMDIRIDTSLN